MNSQMTVWFVALLLGPGIVFLLQCLLGRILVGKSPQLLAMFSMLMGYPFFFFILGTIPFSVERSMPFWIYMFLIYSFSTYTYFHLFNMSETSRRIRMLNALRKGNSQNVDTLEKLYDDSQMIKARLNRLVALKQIQELNQRFFVTGRLFPYTAHILSWVSGLLGRPWLVLKTFESTGLIDSEPKK